jgi:hypothetical protein
LAEAIDQQQVDASLTWEDTLKALAYLWAKCGPDIDKMYNTSDSSDVNMVQQPV